MSNTVKIPRKLYKKAKAEQQKMLNKGYNISLFPIAVDICRRDNDIKEEAPEDITGLLRRFRL